MAGSSRNNAFRLLVALLLPVSALAGNRLSRLGLRPFLGIPIDNFEQNRAPVADSSYIINWDRSTDEDAVLDREVEISGILQKRDEALGKRSEGAMYTKNVNITRSHYTVVNDVDEATLLRIMDMDEVRTVEVNQQVEMFAPLAQSNAPEGLIRLSNPRPDGEFYIFDDSGGEGATVYVIDTGINIEHTEFSGGRATWGANFVPGTPDTDEHGHGTHCAGTIAGRTYGVAKRANVVAVKVFGQGGGSFDAVLMAMEWVSNDVEAKGLQGRAVVSMSLGGPIVTAINDAVEDLVEDGITVVVAAGNDNADARDTSPASAPLAITVGAIDARNDERASFSNWGPAVDIFAPGVAVLSSWIGSTEANNTISGTSMATPHVAGLAAYLMTLEGLTSAVEIRDRMVTYGTQVERVQGLTGVIGRATTNIIANNGFFGGQ